MKPVLPELLLCVPDLGNICLHCKCHQIGAFPTPSERSDWVS